MQTLSQCATGYCEYHVDETQRSEEYCYMFFKTGLLCESVAQEMSAMAHASVCGIGRRLGPRGGRHTPHRCPNR